MFAHFRPIICGINTGPLHERHLLVGDVIHLTWAPGHERRLPVLNVIHLTCTPGRGRRLRHGYVHLDHWNRQT